MPINLEEHKIYVDSLKLNMVPYSVAVQAIQEVTNLNMEKYAEELEKVMTDLRNSLNNISLDE